MNSFCHNAIIHPEVFQNWGPNTKMAVLDSFNTYWTKSIWPWGASKIICIKEADKSAYDTASSFRPLSITRHIGKLFERMIDRRLHSFQEEEVSSKKNKKGFKEERTCLDPSTDSMSKANW